MVKSLLSAIFLLVWMAACVSPEEGERQKTKAIRSVAQKFLDEYEQEYRKLYTESSEAAWAANTKIIEGDTATATRVQQADEAYAAFVGSKSNIKRINEALSQKEYLSDLQVRQLERMLYMAANNPATASELISKRIRASNEQNNTLYGFRYVLYGDTVTTNDIDRILKSETDVEKRLAAWRTSKEVGKPLKDGLETLVDLKNNVVKELNYDNYFGYQVSDYGMTTDEMMELTRKINRELRPLYRELHTYARYELAKKYNQPVPDMLPAHWLPNRWGQDWSPMITVEGIDLDPVLQEKGPEWLVEQSERFYTSLGFPKLPQTFYERSSLYPLPPEADYTKNNHASAWHIDLGRDVRSLMSVVPNTEWYETTHHELGHIYYFLTYSNEDVPLVLREGANRAFHEAMGSLMGLAAMQKPFISGLGLVDSTTQTDRMKTLLKEALNYVVFIPFATGTMTEFEYDLYANGLPKDRYNQRWWALKKQYQGIVPPQERGEEYCDAASKTHINDDAAQYYDYALSYVLLFQMHDYIAKNILKQDPQATNYYGNQEVGKFLRDIMRPGATQDWRKLLQEKTGEELSARALLDYFSPLTDYLKEQNKGRTYTLKELE